MMKSRVLWFSALSLVSLPTAHAADWYWDADGDATTTTGGAGNWTLAGINWRQGSATGTLFGYNAASGPNSDTAANLILAGGTDTLTMTLSASTTYAFNRITANNTYTLATNTAVASMVGTTPTVNVASGKTLVWGIDLSAAGTTVTKSGSGNWQFNSTGGQVTSNNTLIDVTAGTLQFNTSGATANLFTGTGGTVKVGTGSTLSLLQSYSGGYTSARNWTLGSTLNLNGGTFNAGSSNGALFMRLLNTTAIEVNATSTIAQSSGNFSQLFTIESAFTGTAALNLNRAASNNRYLNLKGDMSGYSGGVTIGTSTATGYVLFGNASGWGTGDLSLTGSGSRVMIGDQAATEYNSGWTGGSALSFISGTFAPTGTITLGASSELGLTNTTASHAIVFSPAAGITVNGGTLSRNGSTGTSVFRPAASTTWTFGGSALSTVSGPLSLANTGTTLSVGDAVTTGDNIDTTITGVLSGSQLLNKTGSGTLALGNAGNTHDGGILVNNGAVRLLDPGALGGSTSITVENAENPAAQDNNGLELSGGGVFGTGATLTLRNNSTSNASNARARLLNQSGDNTWAGNIVLDQGTNQTLFVTAGTLTISGNISQGTTPAGGMFIRGGAGTGIITGNINLGTGAVNKTDAGTWEIQSSGHTWGGTSIGVGTLRLGTTNALPTTTSVNIGQSDSNNATLDLNGSNQTLAGLTANLGTGGTKQVTSATAATLTVNNSGSNTYAGVLAGSVALTKTNSGTLTLSGTSTHSGPTLVSAGTLLVSGQLGSSDVTVEGGATFGGTGTIGGDLAFDAGSFLHIADLNDALTVSGTITFGTGFGIANLTNIDWDSLDLDTPYTLLSTTQTFSSSDISNFGLANASAVGTGRLAYFQNGSLQLVVIPEPGAALLGGLGGLLLLRRRRA